MLVLIFKASLVLNEDPNGTDRYSRRHHHEDAADVGETDPDILVLGHEAVPGRVLVELPPNVLQHLQLSHVRQFQDPSGNLLFNCCKYKYLYIMVITIRSHNCDNTVLNNISNNYETSKK